MITRQRILTHFSYLIVAAHREIKKIAALLDLPEVIRCPWRETSVERGMALAIVLAFLAFPSRKIAELEDLFHREHRKLCS
jgi:hypothetical protein